LFFTNYLDALPSGGRLKGKKKYRNKTGEGEKEASPLIWRGDRWRESEKKNTTERAETFGVKTVGGKNSRRRKQRARSITKETKGPDKCGSSA